MRMLLAAALALSLLSCSSASKKAGEPRKDGEPIPLVGSYEVVRYTLDNGLRLLVVEDHSSPTFAYMTWFRVGSRDEQVLYTGLAHLFEHMMFKETKNLKDGEFDKILESAGAEGENAFTSRDYTAYTQEMPVEKLELIAKLESDRMVNLVVDDKAFTTEREVVKNEREMRTKNSPDGTMYEEMFGTAFTKHPYHWPVIGYEADLNRMSAEDARKFYKSYYSPNHATVVVVGDVKPEHVLEVVKKYYGALPHADSPVHVIKDEPPQTAARRKTTPLNIQVEKIMMGYHIPAVTSEDTPIIDVLQAVLSSGKSSRLNRALVETGIASTTFGYGIDDRDPSLFIIGANLQKGKKAAQAESVILRELARLAKEPVTEKELARARNLLAYGFYENLSTNLEKAQFLGHAETVTGRFEDELKRYERIQTVTPAELQAVARKYLMPNNRTVITGVPK